MKALYINDEGKAAGPYPLEQLRELLQSGVLTPDSLASQEPDGPWLPLKQYEAMLERQPKSSLPAPRLNVPPPISNPPKEKSWSRVIIILASVISCILVVSVVASVALFSRGVSSQLTGSTSAAQSIFAVQEPFPCGTWKTTDYYNDGDALWSVSVIYSLKADETGMITLYFPDQGFVPARKIQIPIQWLFQNNQLAMQSKDGATLNGHPFTDDLSTVTNPFESNIKGGFGLYNFSQGSSPSDTGVMWKAQNQKTVTWTPNTLENDPMPILGPNISLPSSGYQICSLLCTTRVDDQQVKPDYPNLFLMVGNSDIGIGSGVTSQVAVSVSKDPDNGFHERLQKSKGTMSHARYPERIGEFDATFEESTAQSPMPMEGTHFYTHLFLNKEKNVVKVFGSSSEREWQTTAAPAIKACVDSSCALGANPPTDETISFQPYGFQINRLNWSEPLHITLSLPTFNSFCTSCSVSVEDAKNRDLKSYIDGIKSTQSHYGNAVIIKEDLTPLSYTSEYTLNNEHCYEKVLFSIDKGFTRATATCLEDEVPRSGAILQSCVDSLQLNVQSLNH